MSKCVCVREHVCVCVDSNGPLLVDAVHSAVPEVFHSERCLPKNYLLGHPAFP